MDGQTAPDQGPQPGFTMLFGSSSALKRIDIDEGDITREKADAIVNAANTVLRAGGGVDGAIHRAAGPKLQVYLDKHFNGCATGQAVLTPAFDLPAKAIIHCVGPIWHGGGAGEDRDLKRCYLSALALCLTHTFKTVAFPAISTGVYGFPLERATRIAVPTIAQVLKTKAKGKIDRVRFICFSRGDAEMYRRVLKQLSE